MSMGIVEELAQKIRDIPDFPQKGIIFKDITPLLNDPRTFRMAIDAMAHQYVGHHIDLVVGIEARGFIIASALAYILNAGLIPLTKTWEIAVSHPSHELYAGIWQRRVGDSSGCHQTRAASHHRR